MAINSKLASILALLLVLAAFFLLSTRALAQNRSNHITTLASGQTVNGDYFAGDSNINLEGVVNGDAFLAGGNVNVDGVINGDLLVAGGNLNIKGRVLGSIRAAGGQVSISGVVGKNVSVAGGNINLSGAKLGGNLDLAGGQILLGNGTAVGRDLTYWSQNQAQVSSEASVSGKITQNAPPQRLPNPGRIFLRGFILFVFISLLGSLIMGLLMIYFMPIYTQRTVEVINQRPGSAFLAGLFTMIITPILVIGLAITVVGIPLALLLVATLLMFFFLARIFAALYIGQKILRSGQQPYWALVLGLVVLGVIAYIPILGGLTLIVLGLMGVGSVVIEEKGFYSSLRSKKLI